jgi:threonine synthase
VWFDDKATLETMIRVWNEQKYILDPHGAVAYAGLDWYKKHVQSDVNGIFLECAHPAKFSDSVEKATGIIPEIPDSQKEVLLKPKRAMMMSKHFDEFKDWLLHDEGCSC